MGNSPAVKAAMRSTFEKLMAMPRWKLRLSIWWNWHFHRRHWSTEMLKACNWFDQFSGDNHG